MARENFCLCLFLIFNEVHILQNVVFRTCTGSSGCLLNSKSLDKVHLLAFCYLSLPIEYLKATDILLNQFSNSILKHQ